MQEENDKANLMSSFQVKNLEDGQKAPNFPGYIELNSKTPLSRSAMKFRPIFHLCQDLNSLGFHICKGMVTSSVVRGIGIIYLQYSNDSQ